MAPSADTLRAGDVVDGKYRVESHLSSGGMGQVYVAEHIYTHRRVALKVTRPRDDSTETRFLREAEAVCAIDHPAVVEMLDAGRAPDGTLYAVFELLEGADLEVLLDDGGVPPMTLVRIAIRLLEALAATHSGGYVHRDVKPANIFIGWDASGGEQVKLLDFGIAERIGPDGAPALGHRVGTLEYMSPEQAAGANVDGRTDIWSVGVILFRGLVGNVPLDVRPRELLRRLMTEDMPSVRSVRPDVPEDLADVVDRALARRRQERWSGAEDMAQALLLLDTDQLADMPSTYSPPLASPPAWPTVPELCGVSTVDLLRAS